MGAASVRARRLRPPRGGAPDPCIGSLLSLPVRSGMRPGCCECSGLGRGSVPDAMHGGRERSYPPWRSGTRTGCDRAHRPPPPPSTPHATGSDPGAHGHDRPSGPYAASMSDEHLKETTVERRIVHRGRFMTFRVDTIEDAGGKHHTRGGIVGKAPGHASFTHPDGLDGSPPLHAQGTRLPGHGQPLEEIGQAHRGKSSY